MAFYGPHVFVALAVQALAVGFFLGCLHQAAKIVCGERIFFPFGKY